MSTTAPAGLALAHTAFAPRNRGNQAMDTPPIKAVRVISSVEARG